MSVDLPEPDGPMIAVYAPRCRSMSTPAQGVHAGVALAVELGDAAGLHDGVVQADGRAGFAGRRRRGGAGLRCGLGHVAHVSPLRSAACR